MKHTSGSRRIAKATGLACALAVAGGLLSAPPALAATADQPKLGARSGAILTVNGLQFRDLDGDGALTPYEDWRLSPSARAKDLVSRLSLEQKAGQLMHASLSNNTAGTGYDTDAFDTLVQKGITTYISRLSASPASLASQNNGLQAAAEAQPFGIPLKISTDPRNGFTVTEGQTVASAAFSTFPDAIGMGAADSPALTKRMGNIIRQEYRAVGITEALSPQADLATEPRWTRINGTFGSNAKLVSPQVSAYIRGVQGGSDGAGTNGVATVVKHWVGYGAQVKGRDSHYHYGRFASFEGNNFAEHIVPFKAAFAAGASGVMPTYSILKDLKVNGKKIEQVGAGFNSTLLQTLLRKKYGFTGVVTSDWGITSDCPKACQAAKPPAPFFGPWGVGMPWGVEKLSVVQRYAKTLNAGVDIIGNADEPENVVQAVDLGLLSTARVNEAARRVLAQKFQLGLFENPYVSPARAKRVVGNAQFQAVGNKAQAKSLTLLTNTDKTLPLTGTVAKNPKVYLHGVDAAAAKKLGLKVVAKPGKADIAIVRLADPRSGKETTGLNFTGKNEDYAALKAASKAGATTIAVPQLSRPLILGNVVKHSDAVLANYGVSDRVLLRAILGKVQPGGSLPFELPSSMKQVRQQQGDVPDDTKAPLFDVGFGLSYR